MKASSITRPIVVGVSLLGTVLIATSQPTVASSQRGGTWPTHKMIPEKVSMSQVQEFKDAATLHLNDVQKSLLGQLDSSGKFPSTRCIFSERVIANYINHYVLFLDKLNVTGSPGGTVPAAKLSAAQLAMLYYTFDQGIDRMKGGIMNEDCWVGRSGISLNVSPKDMGMTFDQFKQSVGQYCEMHPMRFWNQARVGLASMK